MSNDQRKKELKQGSYTLLVASAALFGLCLPRNAFCVDIGCHPLWPGYGVLLMGWLEPLAIADVGPFVAFAWYANLCIGLTWIFVIAAARRWALIFGLVGALLGLFFLLGNSVVVAESGSAYRITGYAAGYWLWLGSLCLALFSATLLPKSEVSVLPSV